MEGPGDRDDVMSRSPRRLGRMIHPAIRSAVRAETPRARMCFWLCRLRWPSTAIDARSLVASQSPVTGAVDAAHRCADTASTFELPVMDSTCHAPRSLRSLHAGAGFVFNTPNGRAGPDTPVRWMVVVGRLPISVRPARSSLPAAPQRSHAVGGVRRRRTGTRRPPAHLDAPGSPIATPARAGRVRHPDARVSAVVMPGPNISLIAIVTDGGLSTAWRSSAAALCARKLY